MSDLVSLLGREGRSVVAEMRRRHGTYLRLFNRALQLASEVLLAADVRHRETQKIVTSALLGRLHAAAQGGALLTLHGLEHDGAVAVRACFEVLVNLRGCAQLDGFYRRYLDSDLVRQRKLCRGGQRLSDVSEEQRERFRVREGELTAAINQRNAKELKVEALAEDLGMSDSYNTVYRLTCAAVHSAPRLLGDFARTKDGKLTELVFGTSDKFAPIHLFSYTDYLLLGTRYFAELVRVDRVRSYNRLRSDLSRVLPVWPDEEHVG